MANRSRYNVSPGDKFGRLTVRSEFRRYDTNRNGRADRWLRCVCECGNSGEYQLRKVVSGHTSSCGCLVHDTVKVLHLKHGETKDGVVSAEYEIWTGIIDRCCNPKHSAFHHYGGRGIRMCNRWRNSFEAFLHDMGRRPSGRHSIDRINVDGDYEPGNCRWATIKEQRRNTRVNRRITIDGETLCVIEWAERVGIDQSVIRHRLASGWDERRAVLEPVKRIKR